MIRGFYKKIEQNAVYSAIDDVKGVKSKDNNKDKDISTDEFITECVSGKAAEMISD